MSSEHRKNVLFIQHGEADKPGHFADVVRARGGSVEILRSDLGQQVPTTLDGYAGLALGGGPQGVYEMDRFPYLAAEVDLIRHAARREMPVLGLCLGAQLMASALGGDVKPGDSREVGFYPVSLDPIARFDPLWCGIPNQLVTAHWHGDIFEIPPGGMKMASSSLTPNQLFRYGHALYGLQFHLEMTPQIFDEMIATWHNQLENLGLNPHALRSEAQTHLPATAETAATVFSRWFDFL